MEMTCKKRILLPILISTTLLLSVSCKTPKEAQEDPQVNESQTVEIQEYVSIEGTKISIQPPVNFTKAHTFTGFQEEESGSSIMVVQFPAAYEEIKKGMTPENFKTKGIIIDSTRNLRIDGSDATLMFGKQSTIEYEVGKVFLIIGNEDEVYLLNGNYPLSLNDMRDALESSFLSCKYDINEAITIEGPEDYTMDLEIADLQLANKIGVAYYYSEDGAFPTEKEHKTSLIATRSFGEVSTDDPKQYAINRFYKLPHTIESIEGTEPITIDDVDGYITKGVGKSKKDGTRYSITQVILFSDDMYYIFLATVENNHADRMKGVIETIKTFKRR